ncbi:MAG: VOC family protein [Parcubacteria group bacterium]|nr:VOC family protein [Parcubacteria group bacterium]
MNRVIHFEIQADDVARAQKFYESTFGWKIEEIMKKEDGGMMDYWSITTGDSVPGINGGLYARPKDPKDGEKFYLYDCTIDVPHLDKAVEAVKMNGGKITKEKMDIPEVGFFARAEDTEGNRFGIMQAIGQNPI